MIPPGRFPSPPPAPPRMTHLFRPAATLSALALFAGLGLPAAFADERPEFPPHADVLKGFDKVASPTKSDGTAEKPLWTLYTRSKDGQMFAELPGNFASQQYFIALTVAAGEEYAGLQQGDLYVKLKRYDKVLAVIQPNTDIRTTVGEAKASVNRLFTDRVLMEIPIVTMGPSGGPVIDMDQLCVGKASLFFPGTYVNRSTPRVFSIEKAKAFAENVEVAYQLPGSGGQLKTLHYSFSVLKPSPGFSPARRTSGSGTSPPPTATTASTRTTRPASGTSPAGTWKRPTRSCGSPRRSSRSCSTSSTPPPSATGAG